MTDRPNNVEAGPHTEDDGLFGPDSITWRVMASPATGVAASAAAMIQMLYPPVMYVIDQASGFRAYPEQRAKRTGDYTITITYGDTASAEQAGATLRRLHATRKAVDPSSGQHYQADDPELLDWVHNSLTWALLRGYRAYGPALTAAEEDTFVAEQRAVSGRLVGCVVDDLPDTVSALDEYMDSMTPKLAMSTPALWFRDMIVPQSRPKTPDEAVRSLFANASVYLMGEDHQQLYGFRDGRLKRFTTTQTVKALLSGAASKMPLEKVVPQMREYADAHAFGRRRVRRVEPAQES